MTYILDISRGILARSLLATIFHYDKQSISYCGKVNLAYGRCTAVRIGSLQVQLNNTTVQGILMCSQKQEPL